ncbi:MAG: helix-turn-helix transcriptional regulator [Firmicutes bacterium]|nr:helix-turn-helix transcriptional regulator [Bacillota bacterium]
MKFIEIIHLMTEATRFKILQLLIERHYCVRAIAKKLDISESAVSQHMNVLKNAGLISGSKIGHHMHYLLNRDLLEKLLEQFSQFLKTTEQAKELTRECFCEYECDRKH